jgi:hypothetical protein
LPYGNTDTVSMSPSTKKHVLRARVFQLVLRCIELLGSLGLLAATIMIKGIASTAGLLMRIPVSLGQLSLISSAELHPLEISQNLTVFSRESLWFIASTVSIT